MVLRDLHHVQVVAVLLFRFPYDAVHRMDCLDGESSNRRLGAEHHRIRTIHYCVGNVIRLRTGRARIFDHRFEHLRSDDHRNSNLVALSNDHLLDDGDIFRRKLNSQVTPCDHNHVCFLDDRIDRFNGFPLLDFCDDRDTLALGGFPDHDFTQLFDIISRPHEREGYIVNVISETKLEVVDVLLGE